MENEKIDNLDNTSKLPNTWKVIILSCALFIVIFCLFTLVNFVNVLMLMLNILNFFSDPSYVAEGDLGDIPMALGVGTIIFFGVLLFILPLNIYIALHGTKRILHKWYNNIPIFQTGKVSFLAIIFFSIVFFVSNMLWLIIWILPISINSHLVPFYVFSGYIELFLLGLSLYISKIMIKKLIKGMPHE